MIAVCESRLVGNTANDLAKTYRGPAGTIWIANDFNIPGSSYRWGVFPYPERHGKRYNMVFCDGHVEGIDPAVAFNLTNSAARWNKDHQPHPETWY